MSVARLLRSGGLAVLATLLGPLCPPATAAPPAAAPHRGVLSGTVVDEQRRPVANVEVEAHPCPFGGYDSDGEATLQAAWWDVARDVLPLAVATTDADGRWRFDGLDPVLRIRLRVKPTAGRTSDGEARYPGLPWEAVTLVARGDRPVSVRVVDEAGKPVGADVLAFGPPGGGGDYESPVRLALARTDEEGRARLVGLPRGRLLCEVRVPGVAVVRTGFTVPSASEVVVRIRDAAGTSAEGVVRDVETGPLARARVAITVDASKPNEEGTFSVLLAETDAAGKWRIQGLPVGVVSKLGVEAEGYVPAHDLEDGRATTHPQPPYDVVLMRGGTLEGIVTDEAGAPAVGAQVAAGSRVMGDSHGTTSDAQGRWRLSGLGGGLHELLVRARGSYLPDSPGDTGFHPVGGMWIEPDPGATRRAPALRLRRGVRVVGRVLAPDGKPVAGAWLLASSKYAGQDSMRPGYDAVMARSGPDGTYALEGLVPGEGWLVCARAEGLVSEALREAQVRDEGRDVRHDLVLQPVATLVVRILDLAGKPTPGVELALEGPERRVAQSDTDGRIVVDGLRPGTYRLTPTYHERRNAANPLMHHSIRGDELAEAVFRLDPPRSVSGVVLDEQGRPAPGVIVELKADEPWEMKDRWMDESWWWAWSTVSDAEGRFVLENLGPGGYFIRPDKEDGADFVEAGDTHVQLKWYRDALPEAGAPVVRPPGRYDIGGEQVPLEVIVLDPAGAPVPHVTLSIVEQRKGGHQSHGEYAVDGRCRTAVSKEATSIDVVAVSARDASGRRLDLAAGRVDGAAPTVGRVEVRMVPVRSIVGRVLDDAGAPVPGARVYTERPGTEKIFEGRDGVAATDEEGRFVLRGLSEGTYALHVRPGARWKTTDATVPAGGPEVVLRLEPAGFIAGKVVDEADAPVVGAGVSAEEAREATSFDGTFRLAPVSVPTDVSGPHAWRSGGFEPEAPRYAEGKVSAVQPGTTDLVLRLRRVVVVSGHVRLLEADRRYIDAKIRLVPEPADPRREPVEGNTDWDDGRFEVEVPPGRWRLTATTEDWNGRDHTYRSTSRVVTAPASDLELTIGAKGVRGRLAGKDVEGFVLTFLTAAGASPEPVAVATQADGSFFWETEEQGPFLLHAARPGDARFALVDGVRAGDVDVEVPLAEGRRIEGRLTDGGKPPESSRATVWARSGRGLLVHALLEADGRFVFSGLPPNETWTLEARAFVGDLLKLGALADVASGTTGLSLVLADR